MLRPDVIELRSFYGTALGQSARRILRGRIREFWPDLRRMHVLGLGYATPFLRPFVDESARAVALMPAQQGVVPWPPGAPGLVALGDEFGLPFPDACFDRVLLVHGLEAWDSATDALQEVWRVLAAHGRLLVIVPNRSGLWARQERTPFGHGHPYSQGQIVRQLQAAMFSPLRQEGALYVPPSERRWLLRAAGAWERTGRRISPQFCGVWLAEAEKQVYQARAQRSRRRARLASPVQVPVLSPAPYGPPRA
ncbi:class I SAM-dependent methyltransferase [Marinibaculum pumilum]|uniref:Class I SAM-dependent methyltransferase n=1 Tax=Marinibaculum pumilum TaxID=1766165 RepID=A0ABV7L6J0_9PROT